MRVTGLGRFEPSAKPSIQAPAKDIRYYIEGEIAEIAIPVFGIPVPIVKWRRSGLELAENDGINAYKMFRDRMSNENFEISNAGERDEGLYELVAVNEHGEARHEFYLQQADPPVFLEPFKDAIVKNHEDVQILCKVDGIPYPEVKFYKDWHLMAESHRIRIKHIEPDTWVITIHGSIVRDSGLYTCTARNIAGGTLCSCNVSVVDSVLNIPHPDLKTDLVVFKRRKFDEDYEIIEEISQSLNSKIYRVIERRTAKEFIAKLVHKSEYFEWLKNESDCLNQIHQINTSGFVKLHDAYETPGQMSMLVFEECKGKNVLEFMLADPGTGMHQLQEKKVALYVKQLLELLQHLHSRNIVHLDINPDNLLVDAKTKRLKLIGFTHSKCLRADMSSNDFTENVHHDYGEAEFVAPEVVTNSPITLNTDMWSVGVLSYILLGGKSPFNGSSVKETLNNIGNCKWEFTDEFASISHDAKDFIQRLFVQNPKERMSVDQALAHPWIHYALQQTNSQTSETLINKQNLIETHSRRVWANQAKQIEPWTKQTPVSSLLEELDARSDTGISSLSSNSISTDSDVSGSFKARDRSVSVDQDQERQNWMSSEDDESLNPGTYLLPVKDPLFTVRLREYRRTRHEKVKQLATSIITTQHVQKPVKERYHIDVYGRCVQRGSLSRSTTLRGSSSAQRSSESPRSSVTRTGEVLSKPFEKFIDSKYDKRNLIGEGFAPVIREKLKDMYLLVGSVVTFRCRIEGNPSPKCFWYHNDRLIIGDDDRFKFAQAEDGVITLSVSKARVSDIGVYRCAARNQFGTAITNARLTVGDTPDRPSRPIVAQYSSDQVYLVWEGPSFNGNSDILCYKVDFKVSDDVKWSNALFTIQECCLIRGLHPLTNYRFRVSCINTIGVSSYSWASEEVTTLAPGESKLTIEHNQVQALLMNQYNLEKRSQQLVLVKRLDEELSGDKYKIPDDEVFKIQLGHNPSDLYSMENKVFQCKDLRLVNVKDNANQTKRLIKFNSRLNENEIRILRELREQDRVIKLIEGFEFTNISTNRQEYALVYVHAVPVIDFLSIKHKYSEELVVKILRQLLDAIQWIHLHGFVHLNIHPLTILNSNLTQVNIKLSGFENSIQYTDLARDADESYSKILSEMSLPLEFKGFY